MGNYLTKDPREIKISSEIILDEPDNLRSIEKNMHKEFEIFVNLLKIKFKDPAKNVIDLNTGETTKFHAIDFYSTIRDILIVSTYYKDKESLKRDFDSLCTNYRTNYGLTEEEELSLSKVRDLFLQIIDVTKR